MNQSARLERRYRRLLACYPRAFRRKNEDEILAVPTGSWPAHRTGSSGRAWPRPRT